MTDEKDRAPEQLVPLDQNSEDAVEDADASAVVDPDRFGRVARGAVAAVAPDVVPGEGKSRHPRRAVIALVLVVALVGCVVAAATYGAELWGGKSVPYVMGISQEAAGSKIRGKGLAVKVATVASDDPVGTVVRTSPAAGTRARVGSTVTVYVARARVVPKVSGLQLGEAKKALRKSGAKNFSIAYVASGAADGSVVATEPAEGATFQTSDTITIKVARPYTVPYVVGKTEEDARAAVAEAGLVASVTYVNSDEVAQTVVAADPVPGTTIEKGATVTLQVSAPYPSDYHLLREYFDYKTHVTEFLKGEGFRLSSSSTGDGGVARVLYTSADKGNVTVTDTPFSHSFPKGSGTEDVLASGAPLPGIRLDFASADLPENAATPDESTVRQLADLCGFTGMSQTLTQDQAVVPSNLRKSSARFLCAYGEMGDYCWSVLVVREADRTRAAATCAPKSLYDAYDLGEFNNSVCDMIACVDVYG